MCQAVEIIERVIYTTITALLGTPLTVHQLSLCASTAGDTGSIPDQGIKQNNPHLVTQSCMFYPKQLKIDSFSDELLVLIVLCVCVCVLNYISGNSSLQHQVLSILTRLGITLCPSG